MSSRYLGELTLTSVHLSQSHSWFVGSRHPDRKFLERASGKGADFAPAENKSHKHAVRHILSGSFLRRYQYWRSFDPMTLFSPTFDGGQAKVRLNNAKFSNYTFFKLPPKVFFFCVQGTFILLRNSSVFQIFHQCYSTTTSKSRKSKN